jgi:hypothetical protein
MINTKLQNIIDTKAAIGNAINNKGGSITAETPFYEYAPAIENISTGGVGNYTAFVAQAQDNSLYTVYNGYHQIDNPTPNLSNNFTFNQWLLNNSATGDVILSNVITSQVKTVPFLDNSVGINEAYIPFVNNTPQYNGRIENISLNNGFIYVGGDTNNTVQKFYESNLAFVGNTVSYDGEINSISINNGFIYAGGNPVTGTNRGVSQFHESNLVLVGNTVNYGRIVTITTNNGFIYAGGLILSGVNRGVTKFYESNLALSGANLAASSTSNYGGTIYSIAVNNGFIYAGGATVDVVRKYNESTLAIVGNTASYGGDIRSIAINNGFIYVGGADNQTVQKFHESNLVFVGNTNSYGDSGGILSVTTNNGFIYVGGSTGSTNNTVQKFYESNLAFVSNTVSYGGIITSIAINDGFIYVGGVTNDTVQKFVEQSNNLVETPVFTITNIKE